MENALWITLIGMGLVFVAILLLWGLMALIVSLTAEREAPVLMEEAVPEPLLEPVAPAVESDRKRRAAAAAVAAALALQSQAVRARPSQPAGAVSAWQAVHRAGQLSQRTGFPVKR